jgi:tetratricopeptide (TPR) repeat protein
MRRGRAAKWLADGRQALAEGQFARAKECAEQALKLVPDDAGARALVLDAEGESLRRRVDQEMSDIRAEMEEARASGHLQRALTLCQRLLDLNPDDDALRGVEAGIRSSIHAKEVEQLSSQALAYAADGDVDLALKIAGRIERIAPDSPAFLELRRYLEDQRRYVQVTALTATAQEHLVQGPAGGGAGRGHEGAGSRSRHAVAWIRDRAAWYWGVARRRQAGPPSRRLRPPAPSRRR